jgi:2-oxoglutarate dehydrogenase E2 component (dihydrolipoamide succinyltransferase)
MTIEMKVPAVGESVTQVTIASWMKKDGEQVQADEIICELESDKATFELPAEASGIIRISHEPGTTLSIGDVICHIETSVQQSSPAPEPQTPSAPQVQSNAPTATGEKVLMTVPALGESLTEVTLARWDKKTGDYVKLDEIIGEIESDKATFEITAKAAGILHIIAQEQSVLAIGAPLCEIESAQVPQQQSSTAASTVAAQSNASAGSENYASGHASPAASKILAEKGIAPATVSGSGKDGRITKADALGAKTAPKTEAKVESKSPVSSPAVSADERGVRREKMTSLRKTIARRLVAVKNETAMLTTFNEINMKPVMDLRSKYKDLFKEKHEIGLGFMSFFVKACCVALKEFPAVNAQIDGDEIIYHDFCDVSIAVSTPRGLVVPIIRNADQMSFAEIEKEIIRLAGKARDNKLSIPEMTGGTFTITNGGVFGSLMSTPIINAPQVAILGMHNIVERAVVIDGQIVARPMMYIALSYDHRIIDGRESVSFLVRIKQMLEDPARMLLSV